MKNSLQPYDEEAVCNNHECHHSHFYEQFSIQSQAFQQYVHTFLEHPEYVSESIFVFVCWLLCNLNREIQSRCFHVAVAMSCFLL